MTTEQNYDLTAMVLRLYCVSFLPEPGQKTTHKRLNLIDMRKS